MQCWWLAAPPNHSLIWFDAPETGEFQVTP